MLLVLVVRKRTLLSSEGSCLTASGKEIRKERKDEERKIMNSRGVINMAGERRQSERNRREDLIMEK